MANQLPDISPWLVTPSNPARSLPGLDHDRCAALHNHIIQLAWVGSGRALDELERLSWFERYGNAAEEVRNLLDPSLVSFLEQAYDVDGTMVSFFYWVTGLNNPESLWQNHLDFAEPGEDWRFLTLYPVHIEFGGHIDGLNYDQYKHKAIMQMDLSDQDITRTPNSPPWYPLETVLSTWISMIQMGKITTAPEDVRLDNEKYKPWLNHPYSNQQLEDTVAAFNRLTTAIESRMPGSSLTPSTSSPLLSHSTLTSASIPLSCFARSLLTTVRTPRFEFIAPGLLLPTNSTFASFQPLAAVPNNDEDRIHIPPVLLFRATDHEFVLDPNDDCNFFGYFYSNTIGETPIPAGLYTELTDRGDFNVAEDGFRLFLPYVIGENEFARRSDGQQFEHRAELYQHGYQSFGGEWRRAQRLVRLLENWLEMVEGGFWEVGERGVVGGIEKFREADTEEAWTRYWIEPSW